jgi:hypothetical protein
MRCRTWYPRVLLVCLSASGMHFSRLWKLAWPALFLSSPFHIDAAERWKMQFYYNKDQSILDIRDLQCPSIQRCIAAGVVIEKNDREKGTVLVTSDGGKRWSFVDFKDRPLAIFFRNESVGWIAAEHGVWETDESGRAWKRIEALKKGIQRIYFTNQSHGYAIGYPNALYETTDGGKTWPKLAATPDVTLAKSEAVSYDCIDFMGNHGLIMGRVIGPESDRLPVWMDPQQGARRRERKSAVVGLETFDGGKTWKSNTASAYGSLAEMKLASNGLALVLFQYKDSYRVPSDVVTVKSGLKPMGSVFSEHDRAVTDLLALPGGDTFLAAVSTPGNSNQVPIPGKLKVFRSNNLKLWVEMDSDYRAVAQRAVLAAVDAHHVWVATDTGMILNLVETEN